MERAAVNAAAGRPAQDHRHGSAVAIVRFGDEVGDLIEAAGDEINELHFGHRAQAQIAHAAGGADDGGFADRRFDDALVAESREQALGDLERAAIDADVFAEATTAGSRSISSKSAWRMASSIGDFGHG